jgi:Xaa-Pro aminopeptidase
LKTKDRIEKLRKIIAEKELDGILVSQPENLFYLSGCEGLEGYLLITEQKEIIITDFRYIEQAQRQSPDYSIFEIKGKMSDWLPELFKPINIKCLGYESSHLTISAFEGLSEIISKNQNQPRLIPLNGIIESLRAVKDSEEIERIQQAIKITDSVYEYLEITLKPGMTELALAWEIEKYMREKGSQPVPFDLIVAAGPNSALPHAKPSDYVIKPGDPVVIDIGSKCKYYGSDLTRTMTAGRPDDKFKSIFNIVLDAQQTAISKIKAGMSGDQADSIARNIITRAGYGETFGHSLGHGIGLVTHENPRLGHNSADVLTDGMVFTIEPGIYLSGWGGIRIEDDVVIENGTVRVLSSAKKIYF